MSRKEILLKFQNELVKTEIANQKFLYNVENLCDDNLADIEIFISSNFMQSVNFKYINYVTYIRILIDKITQKINDLSCKLNSNELREKLRSNCILDSIDLQIKFQNEIELDIGFIEYKNTKAKLNRLLTLCNSELIEIENLIQMESY